MNASTDVTRDAAGAKRGLGLWMCVSLVAGNMIGSGIFLLPASLAPYGSISIVGWLITSAGAVALAVVFSRLARRIPLAGGPYAYTRAVFGDFAGFLVGWGYWISILATNAALVTFVIALDGLRSFGATCSDAQADTMREVTLHHSLLAGSAQHRDLRRQQHRLRRDVLGRAACRRRCGTTRTWLLSR